MNYDREINDLFDEIDRFEGSVGEYRDKTLNLMIRAHIKTLEEAARKRTSKGELGLLNHLEITIRDRMRGNAKQLTAEVRDEIKGLRDEITNKRKLIREEIEWNTRRAVYGGMKFALDRGGDVANMVTEGFYQYKDLYERPSSDQSDRQ